MSDGPVAGHTHLPSRQEGAQWRGRRDTQFFSRRPGAKKDCRAWPPGLRENGEPAVATSAMIVSWPMAMGHLAISIPKKACNNGKPKAIERTFIFYAFFALLRSGVVFASVLQFFVNHGQHVGFSAFRCLVSPRAFGICYQLGLLYQFVAVAFRLFLMWTQYCITSLRIMSDARDAPLTCWFQFVSVTTSVTSLCFDTRVLTCVSRKCAGFCEISSAAACNAGRSVTREVIELHCTRSFDQSRVGLQFCEVMSCRRVVLSFVLGRDLQYFCRMLAEEYFAIPDHQHLKDALAHSCVPWTSVAVPHSGSEQQSNL